MAIKKELQYDKGSKTILGTVTLPQRNDSLATKVLTTILASLTKDYKQVVAYDLTGPSVSGKDLWAYMQSIIMACGERGIQVVAVVRSGFSLYITIILYMNKSFSGIVKASFLALLLK